MTITNGTSVLRHRIAVTSDKFRQIFRLRNGVVRHFGIVLVLSIMNPLIAGVTHPTEHGQAPRDTRWSDHSYRRASSELARNCTPSKHDLSCPLSVDAVSVPPKRMEKSHVRPVYPLRGRLARVECQVLLSVVVRRDGTIADPTIQQCSQPGFGFEDSAVRAVEQWRYRPAKLHGKRVAVVLTIEVDFELLVIRLAPDIDKVPSETVTPTSSLVALH